LKLRATYIVGVIGVKNAHRDDMKETPLDHWSTEIDPAIMAGDHWADPDHDLGHKSDENRDFRKGIQPFGGIFMHPTHDVSYDQD